jgi:soluble lytic murein transglycosylase
VAHVLSGLTESELAQPRWQYWQARTMALAGNQLQSKQVYGQLARDRSLYGFLAAEKLQQPYNLNNKPVNTDTEEAAALLASDDFKMLAELRELHRITEAKQQWWFAIKGLSQSQQQIAAKVAQSWQWEQIAILTLVKANYWDDLTVRFPVRYLQTVQSHAEQQKLNPALVFALIRQESMLDENAQSPVGARGLMQIMPKTAQDIADKLNEPWQTEAKLFEPETNIKYGTFYYKQLLSSFGGNLALATAAYNAGPKRVAQWLPSETAMPSDSWIETIPFKETRQYVFAVLSYAIIYQQRLSSQPLALSQLLPDLLPAKN